MKNYANQEIKYIGCPCCAYAKKEFKLPCGIAYENERFMLSQDWEMPVEGFFVVSPKKHIEKFGEMTKEERIEAFEIVYKTINILRKNNVCDRFDVIFEEKENRHFHIWIMPRYEWMRDLAGEIIDNIGQIFEYAKMNFRTEEYFRRIEEVNKKVREEFGKR